MSNTIFIKEYTDEDLQGINESELWRYTGYMGLPDADEKIVATFEQVKKELANAFTYKICYLRMPIEWEKGYPILPFFSESKDLAKCLAGCNEIVLFAATIGLEIDRHIARCGRFAPAKALLMQAYGAERVETLCNRFCNDFQKSLSEKLSCTARFSPGYGDLPLETQKDFFRLLDCNRKIGVSLNESLLMTPSKSVTAVFGIREVDDKICCDINAHDCDNCRLLNCEFRRK